MLDTSKDNLTRELEAGEELRDAKLARFDSMIEEYAGTNSLFNSESENYQPENHSYEYLSLMVPRTAYDNPRVRARSRVETAQSVLERFTALAQQGVEMGAFDPQKVEELIALSEKGKATAQAIEHGLNRWIRDTDYVRVLDRVVYDYFFSYGVLMTSLTTMPGDDPRDPDARRWPTSERISPTRYIKDPQALHGAEAKWRSHWSLVDIKDLQKTAKAGGKDKGWDVDAINRLEKVSSGTEAGTTRSTGAEVRRNDVKLYTMWVPDFWDDKWDGGPQSGYHGALFLLGGVRKDKESDWSYEFLRKPRPYWGPSWGPYAEFGAYVEPDSPYAMSPLQATYIQTKELNLHAKAMSRNAAQYKRLVVVSDRNPKLAHDLKSKDDMYIIQVDDEQFEKKQIAELEVAGISDKQLEHFGYFKDRLDRISGISDTMRGNVKSGITATADAIADDNADVRSGYIQRKFAQAVRVDLMTKAWYMFHEDRIQFPLGPDAGEALGMLQPMFMGGQHEDGGTFEDMEIQIDAYSMPRTNQVLRQRQIMDSYNIIMTTAPQWVNLPYLEMRKMISMMSDAMDMPELEGAINFNLLQQMQQMALGMGGEGGGTSPDGTSGATGRGVGTNPSSAVRPAESAARMGAQQTAAQIG